VGVLKNLLVGCVKTTKIKKSQTLAMTIHWDHQSGFHSGIVIPRGCDFFGAPSRINRVVAG
jgi:hypothetical protein